MPDVITAAEYIEINSIPLATPAWRVTSLVPLWAGPALRGEDRLIEDTEGLRPYRRLVTATRVALPMAIFGDFTRENVPIADTRAGLHDNYDVLYTGLLTPPLTTAGTVTAVWHKPGTDRTAAVHVLGLAVRELSPRAIRATLQLSIPDGVWT